ncbi:MAG TPA: hypothetical protein VKA59_14270 [Vicinamibacterales bacterium]|nr:hypothetical protein [Vicinamibacterales bacterium]
MRVILRAASLAAVLFASVGVTDAAQSRIASAKTLRCSFPRHAVGTWGKDGSPDATMQSTPLVLRFDSIDPDSGTAQLRSGTVSSEVTVRLAEGYLHLMQSFRTGPLYITTVFDVGDKSGKLKVVHSRHEYFAVPLPGATSTPEQYYGDCEILP